MVKKSSKVIITCAVTGSIHTPSMSAHLPVTPGEIAEAAIAAAEAGAAILHLHARDPETGKPSQDPSVYEQFLPRIKQSTNAVVNITTGGSPHMTIEERMLPAAVFKPEVASLNMGSMNFGLYPMLNRFSEFQYDWEKAHLENSKDGVFKNTFKDIETILNIGNENGTRFEFECYDISHLYNLAHFVDRGLAKTPLFIQSVFGLLGGIGGHAHEAHCGPFVWRRLLLVNTWSWSKSDVTCIDWCCSRSKCSRRLGGLIMDQSREIGDI